MSFTLLRDNTGTIRRLQDSCCCCVLVEITSYTDTFPGGHDYKTWVGPDGICHTEDDVDYDEVICWPFTLPTSQNITFIVTFCGAYTNIDYSYTFSCGDSTDFGFGTTATPDTLMFTESDQPYADWFLDLTIADCNGGSHLYTNNGTVNTTVCVNNSGAGGGECTDIPPP